MGYIYIYKLHIWGNSEWICHSAKHETHCTRINGKNKIIEILNGYFVFIIVTAYSNEMYII